MLFGKMEKLNLYPELDQSQKLIIRYSTVTNLSTSQQLSE